MTNREIAAKALIQLEPHAPAWIAAISAHIAELEAALTFVRMVANSELRADDKLRSTATRQFRRIADKVDEVL